LVVNSGRPKEDSPIEMEAGNMWSNEAKQSGLIVNKDVFLAQNDPGCYTTG